jgi:hypothetical protein
MALGGELVHLAARDAEAKREVLRRLSHEQAHDGIGETLHQPDHRREVRGTKLPEQRRAPSERLRRIPAREPRDHRIGKEQRRARQRVDAAGEHQLRAANPHRIDRRIERLHSRRAVAHDRPPGHLVAATHTQRDDAADVHLINGGGGATEDHLVEVGGRERLSQQQRTARTRCEIRRGKGARAVARLQERRARAIDDVDRSVHCVFHEATSGNRARARGRLWRPWRGPSILLERR